MKGPVGVGCGVLGLRPIWHHLFEDWSRERGCSLPQTNATVGANLSPELHGKGSQRAEPPYPMADPCPAAPAELGMMPLRYPTWG